MKGNKLDEESVTKLKKFRWLVDADDEAAVTNLIVQWDGAQAENAGKKGKAGSSGGAAAGGAKKAKTAASSGSGDKAAAAAQAFFD